MKKIVIKPSVRSGAVTVTADELTIDLSEAKLVDGIAEAAAQAVKADIAAAPGDRWDRTGHLRAGIKASGGTVSVPSDRLQRPELVERFRAEIASASNPLAEPVVQRAIEAAIADAVAVQKRGR